MYVTVEALSLLSKCTSPGQVVVVLRVQALPSLPRYWSFSRIIVGIYIYMSIYHNLELLYLLLLSENWINFFSYVLSSAVELTRHVKSKQFLQYEGIVCGLSIVHKYTYVTFSWSSSFPDSIFTNQMKIILCSFTKSWETQLGFLQSCAQENYWCSFSKIARFRCPLETCSGHDGDKFIRIHIPGAREAQTIR